MKIFILFICLIATSALCQTKDTITIGWDTWEPYYYLEGDTLTGLDIEIVKAIAIQAGYPISFVKMPWVRILHSVKLGTIDVAISASKNPEREEYAIFSDPYRVEKVGLFIHRDNINTYTFKSLYDIVGSGFRLGATRGYYYGHVYDSLVKFSSLNEQLELTSNDETHIRKIALKRIDGFILDIFSGIHLLKKKNLLDQVALYPVTIYSTPIHIMYNKDTDPKIIDAFNTGYHTLKGNGTIDHIINKYINGLQ